MESPYGISLYSRFSLNLPSSLGLVAPQLPRHHAGTTCHAALRPGPSETRGEGVEPGEQWWFIVVTAGFLRETSGVSNQGCKLYLPQA